MITDDGTNIIDLEQVKKRLKEKGNGLSQDKRASADALVKGIDRIKAILDEENIQIGAKPKIEFLGAGIFRVSADVTFTKPL